MTTTDHPTDSGRGRACDAIAPLLALRETGTLEQQEVMRVERHLATCAACQRDAALDGALAGNVRRGLLAKAAAPALSVGEIMRATVAHRVSAQALDRRQAQAPSGGGARHSARWGVRLSAVSAALLITLFAVYLFSSAPRHGGVAQIAPTLPPSARLARQTVYLPTSAGLYALRASDGALRWTYPSGIDKTPITNGQPVISVALDYETLYVLATSPNPSVSQGTLLALDASDGAVRWSITIPDLNNGSLLQVGGLLIVTPLGIPAAGTIASDQSVMAFSVAHGALMWRRLLNEPVVSSPVAAGGALYIGGTSQMIALTASSGAVRWTTGILPGARQEGAPPEGVNTSVALTAAGNTVYVLAERQITLGNGTSGAAWSPNYYALSAADGSHLWLTSDLRSAWGTAATPAVNGQMSFIPFLNGLAAFSMNGPEVSWRYIPAGAPNGVTLTGAAISDGVLYTTDLSGALINQNGHMVWGNQTYAVRASDGVELWRALTNGGLNAETPVVTSGVVFASANGLVRALRASDGRQMWTRQTPGPDQTAPPLVG